MVSKRQRGSPSRGKGGSGRAGGRLGWIRDADRTAGRRGTGGDDDDMDGWVAVVRSADGRMEWGKASGARKDWRVSEPSRSGLIFRENPGARNAWCGIVFVSACATSRSYHTGCLVSSDKLYRPSH